MLGNLRLIPDKAYALRRKSSYILSVTAKLKLKLSQRTIEYYTDLLLEVLNKTSLISSFNSLTCQIEQAAPVSVTKSLFGISIKYEEFANFTNMPKYLVTLSLQLSTFLTLFTYEIIIEWHNKMISRRITRGTSIWCSVVKFLYVHSIWNCSVFVNGYLI